MSNVIYNTQKIEEKDEQLLKCTKCGKYNRLNASFCKGCGAKTAGTKTQVIGDKMTQEQESSFFEKYIICPSCNKTSIYKAKFCGKCGFNLDTIKQSFQSQEIGNKLHHKEYSLMIWINYFRKQSNW